MQIVLREILLYAIAVGQVYGFIIGYGGFLRRVKGSYYIVAIDMYTGYELIQTRCFYPGDTMVWVNNPYIGVPEIRSITVYKFIVTVKHSMAFYSIAAVKADLHTIVIYIQMPAPADYPVA